MWRWPEHPEEAIPSDDLSPVYVLVTTPMDQAALHRHMAERQWVPVLLVESDREELWRFHHPDGARPL